MRSERYGSWSEFRLTKSDVAVTWTAATGRKVSTVAAIPSDIDLPAWGTSVPRRARSKSVAQKLCTAPPSTVQTGRGRNGSRAAVCCGIRVRDCSRVGSSAECVRLAGLRQDPRLGRLEPEREVRGGQLVRVPGNHHAASPCRIRRLHEPWRRWAHPPPDLQSRPHLVCRLLLGYSFLPRMPLRISTLADPRTSLSRARNVR